MIARIADSVRASEPAGVGEGSHSPRADPALMHTTWRIT